MNELLVQKALRGGFTLEDLTAKYAIANRPHSVYPDLILLKYDQIESPFAEPLVRECRGLILNRSQNWDVVSFPYTKFFNHGEGHVAPIDWASATIYEKVDGSLITLYNWCGSWQVATSGTPDGATDIGEFPMTFAELFWKIFNRAGYKLEAFDPSVCYMFELCSPWNRVVIPHQDERIVLHGARSLVTGLELSPQLQAAGVGVECVRLFPIQSIGDCLKAADALNPMQQEGFVVVDADYNRIKVKSPQYVALHHMKDGFSKRRMMEVVRTNEHTEFLTYFPEYRALFDEIKGRYNALVNETTRVWELIRPIKDRKSFALEATKHPFSAILFSLYTGKTKSVAEYLAQAPDTHFYRLMGEE